MVVAGSIPGPFLDMYDWLASSGDAIGKILSKLIEFYEKYDQRMETFQMANLLAFVSTGLIDSNESSHGWDNMSRVFPYCFMNTSI